MRAGILNAGWWSFGGTRQEVQTSEEPIAPRNIARVAGWDRDEFERGQVRGLVREVFFSGQGLRIRQVVFSAMEPETEIADLCRQVGEVLAAETAGDVAYVDESQRALGVRARRIESADPLDGVRCGDAKGSATQLASNLFRLRRRGDGMDLCRATSARLYLEELRREFEYSIVAAPAATSHEPFSLAWFADGMVLVLSAQRTRRASALKVKNSLGAVRLLGTVLCEREFPIPSGIYRRL